MLNYMVNMKLLKPISKKDGALLRHEMSLQERGPAFPSFMKRPKLQLWSFNLVDYFSFLFRP